MVLFLVRTVGQTGQLRYDILCIWFGKKLSFTNVRTKILKVFVANLTRLMLNRSAPGLVWINTTCQSLSRHVSEPQIDGGGKVLDQVHTFCSIYEECSKLSDPKQE